MALRYKGEVHGFDIAAGFGYLELLDGAQIPVCAAAQTDETLFIPGFDLNRGY